MRRILSGKSMLPLFLICVWVGPLSAQRPRLSLLSYKVDRVSAISLSTYSVGVYLQVQNDTTTLLLKEIQGELWHKEISFAKGSLKDFYLKNGINNVYVEGEISINDGISVLSVLTAILFNNFSNYACDAKMGIDVLGGNPLTISMRRIPLEKLIEDEHSVSTWMSVSRGAHSHYPSE